MEQENSLIPGLAAGIPENPDNRNSAMPENAPAGTAEEKNEMPETDFSGLDTDGIVRRTQQLIDECPLARLKGIMETLPGIFEARYREEYANALSAFTADGDSPENFVYRNDAKERFNALHRLYKEKKNAASRQAETEREENLKTRLDLIEELKALVQKEESMDKTFQEFRDIQERWRNAGQVPPARLNGLLETYHHHIENFYNYIKINKELRDLDLKHNLDTKLALCEEAEKLAQNSDIPEAFKQLQLLHARWKETGPIPKDQQEPVWERFRAASGLINENHHRFYEILKKEQEDNLTVKEDICTKAEAVANAAYSKISEWNEAAKTIIDLQEEWKRSGTVPQKERNRIYNKFRTACDAFFERKREFHRKTDKERAQNLKLKIALCEKVEALKDSTEWKTTTDRIIACQREWKKIGPVAGRHSDKIWIRFRTACDAFFNNREAHFKETDAEQEKNLKIKKALIEEVRQFRLSGNNAEDIGKLKEFQSRWAKTGFVPIKTKDTLQDEFRKAVNAWFDRLNLNEFDRDLERFRAKLDTAGTEEDRESQIIGEREKLAARIRMLENEVCIGENNIGFITKSSKSQGLIAALESKIGKTRQRLNLLREKLKALDRLL